jgi:hypothetical protein
MYRYLFLLIIPFVVFALNFSNDELNYESVNMFNRPYIALKDKDKKSVVKSLKKKKKIINLAQKEGLEEEAEFKNILKVIKNNQLAKFYLYKKKKSFKISNKEIKKYYNKHKNEYLRAHVYTIVRLKKEDIQKYIKILNNTPKKDRLKKFKEIAKKHSLHILSQKGGDLGFISKKTMAKPFGEIAFSLEENEFNKEPFKTSLGWHLVYVQEYKYIGLEEIKPFIVSDMQEKKFKNWYNSL